VPAAVPLQLKPGHITRDQLVAHAFLLLVAGNATGKVPNATPAFLNPLTPSFRAIHSRQRLGTLVPRPLASLLLCCSEPESNLKLTL
jgi:hypothetical protein